MPPTAWEADFSPTGYKSTYLQQQFAEMYHVLHEMRDNSNLAPAISWAREHSSIHEARGSNLVYDLCRLQYVTLATDPRTVQMMQTSACESPLRWRQAR